MRLKTTFIFLLACLSTTTCFCQGTGQAGTINWTTRPFAHKEFIENKGQFDGYAQSTDKILYGAFVGNVYAFITNHGLVYEYTEHPELTKGEDGEKDKIDPYVEPVKHYLNVTWQGCNNNVSIVASEEQSNYNTYLGKNGGIKANLYKKITCFNVYPGIDAEFILPADKEGLKYNFIVHPGADISVIKIKYSGYNTMAQDSKRNIDILTGWGSFTDHAPQVYYPGTTDTIYTVYTLNNGIESFNIRNLNHSKTLVIDPYVTNWTVNPAVLANEAYDVDYDYLGNVYACGTTNMEVVKMNSAGGIIWSFNGNTYFNQTGFYGCFAVDKIHGSVYIVNGIPKQSPLGPAVIKVNNLGAYVTGINNTTLMYEYWRARFDQCTNQLMIAGGGATGHNDVLRIDTNLAVPVYMNPFFPTSTLYQDLCGMAIDPASIYCYMASSTGDENTHNNHIVQLPMSTLAPTIWNVADGFTFNELGITYTNGLLNNAMNCMAASMHYLYMYDGKNLKEYNPVNGAILLTAALPGSAPYADAGIDVDLCDNIYIGNLKTVYVYNSSLVQTSTIGPLTNTIFDVKLGQREYSGYDSLLYVCGGNFVSSIKLNLPAPGPNLTKSRVIGCNCTCQAKATLNFCGSPDTVGVSYVWSNGQTTHTATGLCRGSTYTVTVKFGCTNQFTDTFQMPAACIVLPVELQSFTTTCKDDYPLLQWSTATETSNDHFTVERTQDNITFENVGTVKGAGNSSFVHNYSLVDYSPFEGNSYYRLSQTDLDGKVTYLGTVASSYCSPKDKVSAFVNNSAINISVNAAAGETYTFTLTDILGRTILTQTNQMVNGINKFTLNPQVSSGIYLLQISGKERILCKKIAL